MSKPFANPLTLYCFVRETMWCWVDSFHLPISWICELSAVPWSLIEAAIRASDVVHDRGCNSSKWWEVLNHPFRYYLLIISGVAVDDDNLLCGCIIRLLSYDAWLVARGKKKKQLWARESWPANFRWKYSAVKFLCIGHPGWLFRIGFKKFALVLAHSNWKRKGIPTSTLCWNNKSSKLEYLKWLGVHISVCRLGYTEAYPFNRIINYSHAMWKCF